MKMKMLTNCRVMNLYVSLVAFLACAACGQPGVRIQNPPGYNLAHPEKFTMPDGLLEISGIAFCNGNPDTVFAEQDEKGRLYRLHPGDHNAHYTAFGKNGDYEDVSIMNNRVFMLRSDGTLFSFAFDRAWPEKIGDVREYKDLVPKGEYEGLYADAPSGRLYVLCKSCGSGNHHAAHGYILKTDATGLISPSDTFHADLSALSAVKESKKFRFRPSAMAKQARTGDWFILSSVNKMLVIAGKDFKVKGAYPLDPSAFRQPEGIAFDSSGNLYISNEGDNHNSGNILKFKLSE